MNGSSPESLPCQESISFSSTLILGQIYPLEEHEPAISEHVKVRTHRMTTQSMNEIYKSKKNFVVTKHRLLSSLKPMSVIEALIDSNWRHAMYSELN